MDLSFFGEKPQKTANLLKVSGKIFKGGRGDSNVSSACINLQKDERRISTILIWVQRYTFLMEKL